MVRDWNIRKKEINLRRKERKCVDNNERKRKGWNNKETEIN